METYDLIIIGAGLLGCFAARNAARYNLRTLVLETREDVCTGISKANTAVIYPGYDTKPGTLKTELCVRGCRDFEALCRELSVRYKKRGSLMVSYGEKSHAVLRKKYEQGLENGVTGLSMLTKEEVLSLEPDLKDVYSGLYCSETATVLPWELCIAAYENAKANGTDFIFNSPVTKVERDNDGYIINNRYKTRAVINCAGLYSDTVREMLFEPLVRIVPTSGTYLVFDENVAFSPKHIIFCEPEEKGKGLTLVPTVTGNLLCGPTESPSDGKNDFSSDSRDLSTLYSQLENAVEDADISKVIRNFGALRPNPYFVRKTENGYDLEDNSISNFTIVDDTSTFLSFIGIKTPGLTCCDELGKLAAVKIAAALSAEKNSNFDPQRKREKQAPGRIVCRCRHLTEEDIIAAVESGAITLDGVKHRCDAMTGRCQGSYCTERIMEIIAREAGVPMQSVVKSGEDSYILESKNES